MSSVAADRVGDAARTRYGPAPITLAGDRRPGTDVAGDDRVDDGRPRPRRPLRAGCTDARDRRAGADDCTRRRRRCRRSAPTDRPSRVGAIGRLVGRCPRDRRRDRGWPAGRTAAGRCRSSSRRWRAPTARRCATSRGNVSRSIDTLRPGSIRSSTDGSSTYVPALIRFDSVSPGAGFSTKRRTTPVVVGLDHTERRRIRRRA